MAMMTTTDDELEDIDCKFAHWDIFVHFSQTQIK
jgi:hypothetical protein